MEFWKCPIELKETIKWVHLKFCQQSSSKLKLDISIFLFQYLFDIESLVYHNRWKPLVLNRTEWKRIFRTLYMPSFICELTSSSNKLTDFVKKYKILIIVTCISTYLIGLALEFRTRRKKTKPSDWLPKLGLRGKKS